MQKISLFHLFSFQIQSTLEYHQVSTIGVRGIRTYAYIYWRTHDFRYAHVDTSFHFFLNFWRFENFSHSHNLILFKKLLLCICFFGLFACPWKRQILYCIHLFKKTLFFNFSYKLFNKYFSLPQSTCQFRVSVRK